MRNEGGRKREGWRERAGRFYHLKGWPVRRAPGAAGLPQIFTEQASLLHSVITLEKSPSPRLAPAPHPGNDHQFLPRQPPASTPHGLRADAILTHPSCYLDQTPALLTDRGGSPARARRACRPPRHSSRKAQQARPARSGPGAGSPTIPRQDSPGPRTPLPPAPRKTRPNCVPSSPPPPLGSPGPPTLGDTIDARNVSSLETMSGASATGPARVIDSPQHLRRSTICLATVCQHSRWVSLACIPAGVDGVARTVRAGERRTRDANVAKHTHGGEVSRGTQGNETEHAKHM